MTPLSPDTENGSVSDLVFEMQPLEGSVIAAGGIAPSPSARFPGPSRCPPGVASEGRQEEQEGC